MSLPFELDQADSLVVTKEECLSVSKYKAYRLLYFLLCLLWAKTVIQKCRVNVSLLCNEPTLSFHQTSSTAMQQLHELKRWNAGIFCTAYQIPIEVLLTNTQLDSCIVCLWRISVSNGIGCFVLGQKVRSFPQSIFQVYQNWRSHKGLPFHICKM